MKNTFLGFTSVLLVGVVFMVVVGLGGKGLEKRSKGFDLSGKKLDFNYLLVIPKIGISSKVTLDVDPWSSQSYLPILDNNIAHGRGTVWPGNVGTSFLFAHSINQDKKNLRGVFYNLDELSNDDKFTVVTNNGENIEFRVIDKKVVSREENGFVITQTNYPLIILQTCYLSDTANKRLLVFAKRV